MMRAILAIGLVMLLTACGAPTAPTQSLVEQAIALQVHQTQQEIAQQIFRRTSPPPDASISAVKVRERRKIAIDGLTGYRVRGTYDLTLKFPKQVVTERRSPFEVYLQRQPEGKTWRLARQMGEAWQTWLVGGLDEEDLPL